MADHKTQKSGDHITLKEDLHFWETNNGMGRKSFPHGRNSKETGIHGSWRICKGSGKSPQHDFCSKCRYASPSCPISTPWPTPYHCQQSHVHVTLFVFFPFYGPLRAFMSSYSFQFFFELIGWMIQLCGDSAVSLALIQIQLDGYSPLKTFVSKTLSFLIFSALVSFFTFRQLQYLHFSFGFDLQFFLLMEAIYLCYSHSPGCFVLP